MLFCQRVLNPGLNSPESTMTANAAGLIRGDNGDGVFAPGAQCQNQRNPVCKHLYGGLEMDHNQEDSFDVMFPYTDSPAAEKKKLNDFFDRVRSYMNDR